MGTDGSDRSGRSPRAAPTRDEVRPILRPVDEDESAGPLPHPADRLWRHPSELGRHGPLVPPVPAAPVAAAGNGTLAPAASWLVPAPAAEGGPGREDAVVLADGATSATTTEPVSWSPLTVTAGGPRRGHLSVVER